MDKKEQILAALADLSRTRGLYRFTMDELAAHAGVSKRTIYRYFRSKEEIVESLISNFMNQMASEMAQIIRQADSPASFLEGVINLASNMARRFINPFVLDDLRRYYPWLWEKIERFRAEKIEKNIFGVFFDQNKGKYVRNIDSRIFTTAFIASVQAVVNPEFILDNDLSFEETVKQLIELFMYGLVINGK